MRQDVAVGSCVNMRAAATVRHICDFLCDERGKFSSEHCIYNIYRLLFLATTQRFPGVRPHPLAVGTAQA
jgi:hypothetical protein